MDFALILLVLVLVTGGISVGYRVVVERGRGGRRGEGDGEGVGGEVVVTRPVVVEYARALFPVVLIVFALRSFVVEPFRIPSGSMLPSLHIGDFILVNKYTYGLRLPVVNWKVMPVGKPERGDVMVFRYPRDPSLNFVKRVVGLPGDVIGYHDKQLFVNGEAVKREADGAFYFEQAELRGRTAEQYVETIGEKSYATILDGDYRGRDMQVTVPAERYFVLGDNRDHSNDSRYWRFVPESHVVGRAFFIWFSWRGLGSGGVHWSRIGTSI